ncbi:hypothetical protein B7C51_03135 [Paenibacillus larvae subsp. pulvifaciens]|uniref:Beta protein n=1 Tax=Paenibacillus larvae subsp. pulvifaciens TaxID=1477 RepID=A0A1V0UPJ3_9BACL|nr:beta family protein [Paenibacillus larvae]ARF67016.1 hypothetical protein B7C51_03135 [Paenibacillus larvae subsp. pulvifaciens]
MFNENHYVPILRWKQGEQKALEFLSDSIKERITPLIEIPAIEWDFENETRKKTIDAHLANFGETLAKSWKANQPVFLDMLLDPLERMSADHYPLEHILQQSRKHGKKIIPVTSSNQDDDYQEQVKLANQTDQLGACIRIQENDFEKLHDNINSLLAKLKLPPEEIDLLVDYGYVNPKDRIRTSIFLVGLINSLPYISKWRNVILCGTSFPKDLSDVTADSTGQFERTEWIIWKDITSKGSVNRNPNFGDYAISNPAPFEGDPRYINMSANIRYTASDKFLIFKGRVTRKFGNKQYHQLAAKLIKHPEYCGKSFSDGDRYIHEVANNNDGPGNATIWRKTGTNHHLSFVANELLVTNELSTSL